MIKEKMEGLPTGFWGKLEKDDAGRVLRWHPLGHHCADVAACCQALLQRTLLRERLARLGGESDLDDAQVSQLSALAALHDIGKHNVGFQNKATGGPVVAGHVSEVLALFDGGYSDSARLAQAIDAPVLQQWARPGSSSTLHLLVASICHHGRPVAVGAGHKPGLWQATDRLDPFDGIRALARATRDWFPAAYTSSELLPTSPPFQHAFSGLVMLADWLGSDRRFFEYSNHTDANERFRFAQAAADKALRATGMDAAGGRGALGPRPPGFDRLSPFEPRPAQRVVLGLPPHQPGEIVVLEAETGSGKTEASLAHFLRLFHAGAVDGLYFALPTRTAATQIHRRVVEAVRRAFPEQDTRPPVVLAVPGYIAVDDRTAHRLPGFDVLWHDNEKERWRFRGWAAEQPKRYLAGAIVVGTVDQALLSVLRVGHAHMRGMALLRHLLVVDEVHASDAYMTRLLEEVLARQRDSGGYALLMSATLGSAARGRLLSPSAGAAPAASLQQAIDTPYPLVSAGAAHGVVFHAVPTGDRPKTIHIDLRPCIADPEQVASAAIQAASLGARVIVLRNTVRDCVATQRALEEAAAGENEALLFACDGVVAPHHARYSKEDREALDASLEARLGKESVGGGCVVVATQTIQQSLDLDADTMFTDLCPVDVLLQRAGRLHRHARERPEGFALARLHLLVPDDRDLGRYIRPDGSATAAHGFGTVYEDLRILEATWRVAEQRTEWAIPSMNRELVERATHPDELRRIADELGWQSHAQYLQGVGLAHRNLAGLNLVDRSAAFDDPRVLFPSDEQPRRVQTRLGEGDRLARFEPAVLGPFGRALKALTLPDYQTRGVEADAVPEVLAARDRSVSFAFGSHRFVYDRLGVRPDTGE